MVPGQANDAPLPKPMLEKAIDRLDEVDVLIGDKGFDGDTQCVECLNQGALPSIPNRKNRTDPRPFNRKTCKKRNCIARMFCKLKQFRRVATRYDKLKTTFIGFIQIAFGFVRLKRLQR